VARDYYEVLGVARDASREEIQAAFRRLARANHPDVNKDPAAEERFKEVNEAYQALSDPEQRRRYDRFGADYRRVPEDWEERVRGRPAGAGARSAGPGYAGSRYTDGGFSDFRTGGGGPGGVGGIDIEDLLGGIFGGRQGGSAVSGADQEAELPLSVEEAYRGGRREVTLQGTAGPRTYTVTIPPGVTDGQRIRLAGQGGQGLGGGRPGDLYLVVRLLPDDRYRVVGRDIVVELPVSPWEAALGATVPVTTPGGEAKVTVPSGSSTGRRLRVRGEGMPNPRGTPGDLLAEIAIMVPRRLTPKERELFTQLANASRFDPRRQRNRGRTDDDRQPRGATR
jgi:curved DNA-binding protein